MRHKRLPVLLPALLALGCPGDWDEPLGPVHGGHIDSRLVGDWSCHESGQAEQIRLTIMPFDKNQYVMAGADPAGREAPGFMRAFTTTVSGHDVMNMKTLSETPRDGSWTYARFWFPQDGHMRIDPVRKEPLDGVPADVESRREAIGGLFENPELWEDGYRCRPFKDEPEKK